MRRLRSTPAVFALLLALYGALWLPALAWPGWRDSPVGLWVGVPVGSIYLFDWMGVPWLLQRAGRCEWGWCPPTLLGWGFVLAVWLGIAWLVAAGVARVVRRLAGDAGAPRG